MEQGLTQAEDNLMALRSQISNFEIPGFVLDGHAACSTVDPELFFPQEIEISKTKVISKYVNLRAAKEVCGSCPLKVACLEYGLRNHELGIWGGLTESQRDDLRRSKRIRTNRKATTPELW
jgi:WhiB family transcriptional regulator, redox-sensing transcriptional regulator